MNAAMLRSDAELDGVFFTAVGTTGIFCRPCRRCRPLEPVGSTPVWMRPLLQLERCGAGP